jgi:hypothetical protein
VKASLLEEQHRIEERRMELAAAIRNGKGQNGRLKSIDEFRCDPRYGRDGTRIDLAFAVYALSMARQPFMETPSVEKRTSERNVVITANGTREPSGCSVTTPSERK